MHLTMLYLIFRTYIVYFSKCLFLCSDYLVKHKVWFSISTFGPIRLSFGTKYIKAVPYSLHDRYKPDNFNSREYTSGLSARFYS